MCQDIGNVSGNIVSGGERNLVVTIATDGYFPARKIEIIEV